MKPEYALCVYGPPVGDQTGWLHQGKKDRMLEILNKAEPRYVSIFIIFSSYHCSLPFALFPLLVPTICKSMWCLNPPAGSAN